MYTSINKHICTYIQLYMYIYVHIVYIYIYISIHTDVYRYIDIFFSSDITSAVNYIIAYFYWFTKLPNFV